MKKVGARKRCRGFTLLEVMIVLSLTTVVLGGTLVYLSFVRERWQDASRVAEQVRGTHRLNERLIRGGLGRGSGMQGAVPVLLDDDETRGVSIVYENSGSHYAVLFAPDGQVYSGKMNGNSPWWVGGWSEHKLLSNLTERRTVVDASLVDGELTIDYVLETETHSLRAQTNQFSWAFRAR